MRGAQIADITPAVLPAWVFLPLGVAKIAAVPVMRRAAAASARRPVFTASSAPWRWPEA